jgi:uncharacterized protein
MSVISPEIALQDQESDKSFRINTSLNRDLRKQEKSMTATEPMQVRNLTRQTQLASSLEVADTAAKRSKGLLGRKGLSEGGGLWIVPCESVHTIGMQFSIDLVYLDRKYRVKKVRSAVPPWRISACLSAHSILELPAGTIGSTQTMRGDLLEISES